METFFSFFSLKSVLFCQDGEFDMDPAAAVALWNTVPPIVSRAEAYKAELKDAETLKYKLENKVRSHFKK